MDQIIWLQNVIPITIQSFQLFASVRFAWFSHTSEKFSSNLKTWFNSPLSTKLNACTKSGIWQLFPFFLVFEHLILPFAFSIFVFHFLLFHIPFLTVLSCTYRRSTFFSSVILCNNYHLPQWRQYLYNRCQSCSWRKIIIWKSHSNVNVYRQK